ncbi:helix-turn-helix transcriptional regulator [Clostridium sp. D2Q-11]|uniref:Helix-turn-helix transcriptional regulator n=1 Tax=Anaeromonas frigoriresistens TaxID=2683708 RepID=A0A942UVE9_9FIRM|nr:helix-turn-helix transcriptional regulator [Anaeromonas frigoriresistens]MBS4539793.1 helix-turn-helix transcriptional regulator [Anaeromonas frigoriresistens]
MIKIKVSELLGKHKMTQKDLAEKADIRPNTVSLLYHEKIQRLDVDMIDKLCKVFQLDDIRDLIEYLPENTDKNN